MSEKSLIIATRGSALALAQSNMVAALCRAACPGLPVELKIIKTTGDKLQTASMSQPDPSLPKGLFTKELEVALLAGEAHLAVHSLKDLPTELPAGLKLVATPKRADVRDVLVYRAESGIAGAARGFKVGMQLKDFPAGATIATSSTRRKAQLQAARPDLNIVEIRGNVPTRLQKVADKPELDGTILAFAGISRLNYTITPDGHLQGLGIPTGLLALLLDVDVMLPCVGQAAIGLEARADDEWTQDIAAHLNDPATFQAVTAERAFLAAMGGGCQSPVGAFAEIHGETLAMRAVSFRDGPAKHSSGEGPVDDPAGLGARLALELK